MLQERRIKVCVVLSFPGAEPAEWEGRIGCRLHAPGGWALLHLRGDLHRPFSGRKWAVC